MMRVYYKIQCQIIVFTLIKFQIIRYFKLLGLVVVEVALVSAYWSQLPAWINLRVEDLECLLAWLACSFGCLACLLACACLLCFACLR